jgi:hypothetical protein
MMRQWLVIVLWGWIMWVTTGMELVFAAERELDLSEPNTIAMVTGKYEGRWIDERSNRNGSAFINFYVNPKGGEKPFYREARFVGSATLDPNKASVIAGKSDHNKLVFTHGSGWSKYTFYEADGQIKARGEYRYETGPMGGTGGLQNLVKVGEVSGLPERKRD